HFFCWTFVGCSVLRFSPSFFRFIIGKCGANPHAANPYWCAPPFFPGKRVILNEAKRSEGSVGEMGYKVKSIFESFTGRNGLNVNIIW
ncbi:MAG: hypothetical protein LAT80_12475, partial [Balneolaceae bacterium]|nr:hypothetical protein [Balneolaceae bacterium]